MTVRNKMKPTQRLREIIHSKKTTLAPGVFDGLSAKLVKRAGFDLVYASGGAIARSSGLPDLGLLSFTEICQTISHIVDATDLPVIADADTGYGNALNVARTMRIFERLGVAGLHLEDQEFPKRCGHLDDKKLVSKQEMVHKIRIARESLADPDFVLIARTDAIAVEGFDRAIERANAYLEAGADMIFVEAPQTIEQIEKIAKLIAAPKLLNMFYGGKTPLVPITQLQQWGYNVIIIPSDLQRAAITAIEKTLSAIKQHGDSSEMSNDLASFKDREIIIETERYLQLDKSFNDSVECV